VVVPIADVEKGRPMSKPQFTVDEMSESY